MQFVMIESRGDAGAKAKTSSPVSASSIGEAYNLYTTLAQSGASDDHNMGDAAQQKSAKIKSTVQKLHRPLVTPIEHPVWTTHEVEIRNRAEALWHEGTFFQATIVTYGWFKPGTKELWQPGEKVFVDSRMALLSAPMSIRTVTFTQDDQSGTRTTLDVAAPWLLNDEGAITRSRRYAPDRAEARDPGQRDSIVSIESVNALPPDPACAIVRPSRAGNHTIADAHVAPSRRRATCRDQRR